MEEKKIAEKIRNLRLKKKITLDNLGEKTGFTKGYLSKLENAKKVPPIATLSRIARALGVEIADFFDRERKDISYSIVRKGERKPVIRDGTLFGYHYESIAYKKHHKKMEPFIITLVPHAGDHTIFHHTGEELMFVLEGKMKVFLGDDTHILKKGDCIYFDSGIPHRGECVGDREAKVLVTIFSE
ncbi:MAG: cupin domain-containing protein [Proteobacteria bacterium]|nr:cupin domain-containing protein [Pseudomonadota bacterium]